MDQAFRTRLVELLSSTTLDEEMESEDARNREIAVSEMISDLFNQQDEDLLAGQSDFVDLVFDLIKESSATWLKNLRIVDIDWESEGNLPLVKRLLKNLPHHLERIEILEAGEDDEDIDDQVFTIHKEQDEDGNTELKLHAYDWKSLHYLETVSHSNAVVDQSISLCLNDFEPLHRLPEILARFADTLKELSIYCCGDDLDNQYRVILYMLFPSMKCLKSFSFQGIDLPLDIVNRIPHRYLQKLKLIMDCPKIPNPMPSQLKEIRMHRLNDQQVLQILQQVPGLIIFQCTCWVVTSTRSYEVIANAVEQHSNIQVLYTPRRQSRSPVLTDPTGIVFKSFQRILLHTHKNLVRNTFGETWQQSLSAAYLPFMLQNRYVSYHDRTGRLGKMNRNYWLLRQVPHLLCKEEAHGS